MGIIKLAAKKMNVLGQDRTVTRKETYSTITSDIIIARISQTSNVKPTEVKAAIEAIKEGVRYFVINGHRVNLGKLGIFGIRSSVSSVAQKEQATVDCVKKLTIGYRPSVAIKEELANISFNLN